MLVNLLYGPIESLLNSFNAGVITDIVIIFFISLICLINCLRGFSKQLFGLVATIGAFLIAYFFSDELLVFIDKNFDLTQNFSNYLYGAFGEKLALQLEPTIENIHEAIISAGLPEFVAKFAENALTNATGSYETIGNFLAELVAHHVLSAGCFMILWLVAKLVLTIVKVIISKLVNVFPIARGVDRTIGLFFGLIKSLIIVLIVLYVIDILPKSIGFINVLRDGVDQSVLGAILRQNNLFATIINSIAQKLSF